MIAATEDMIDAIMLIKRAQATFEQEMYWLSMADPMHWNPLLNNLRMISGTDSGLRWLKDTAKSLEKELHSL